MHRFNGWGRETPVPEPAKSKTHQSANWKTKTRSSPVHSNPVDSAGSGYLWTPMLPLLPLHRPLLRHWAHVPHSRPPTSPDRNSTRVNPAGVCGWAVWWPLLYLPLCSLGPPKPASAARAGKLHPAARP